MGQTIRDKEQRNEQRRGRRRRRAKWPWWLLLLAGIGAGGYYMYTNPETVRPYLPDAVANYLPQQQIAEEADEVQAPATSIVQRGDILISASGIGTLLPTNEVSLGFGGNGTVTHVLVSVGDPVTAGQTLAQIGNDDLRLQITQAAADVRKAELDLMALSNGVDAADLAAAQATLASAQASLNQLLAPPSAAELSAAQNELLSAQQARTELQSGPSTDEQTSLEADLRRAQVAVSAAQREYDQVKWRNDRGTTQQSAALQDATIALEKAQAQYNLSAVGPSSDQISAAQAKIDQATANLSNLQQGADSLDVTAARARITEAQAKLDSLTAGADPDELEIATLNLAQAQDTLNARMDDLSGAVIHSPIDGVVTAADLHVGEQAGTNPVITVVERSSTQIRFWLDELDAGIVTLDNPVEILFEAFPDYLFTGTVARIEPSLVTVDGSSAVQMWSTINMDEHPVNLLYGMNVEVDVTAGETEDALLVPVQAIRELAPGLAAVFVVDDSGELEMRPVEVGLRDFVNAEILSGVELGEEVSTGDIELQ